MHEKHKIPKKVIYDQPQSSRIGEEPDRNSHDCILNPDRPYLPTRVVLSKKDGANFLTV